MARGELLQPFGHAADRGAEQGGIGRAHVDELVDAALAEARGRDGPDAPQRVNRQFLQEVLHAFGGNHRQAVRLAPGRGDLREKLVRRHARRRRKSRTFFNCGLDLPGDGHAQRLAPGVFRDVEVGLVERQTFDQWRDFAKDREDLLRDGAVLLKVRPHDLQRRAQANRAGHRNRRPHAELAGLVAGRRHHSSGFRRAADRHRLAAQLRPVALLDGRVERVHVHVNDAAGH